MEDNSELSTFSKFKTNRINKVQAFDPNLVKFHSETPEVEEDLITNLVNNFEAFAEELELNPKEMVEALFASIQTYIYSNFQENHIAPKLMAMSLSLNKCAIDYGEELALTMNDLISRKPLNQMNKDFKKHISSYSLNIEEIRGIQETPVSLCN